MHQRIFDITGGDKSRDTLRYVIYSAHDVQIANVLTQLNAVDHEFVDVTYGSSVFFELYYDTECIDTLRDDGCFSVKVTHNGVPLKFDTCIEANLDRGSKSQLCTYQDFRRHIQKVSFHGVLETQCK